MSVPQILTAVALGWLGYQLLGKPKKRRPSAAPTSGPTPSVDDGDQGPGGSDPNGPLPKPPTRPPPPGPDQPTPPAPVPPEPMDDGLEIPWVPILAEPKPPSSPVAPLDPEFPPPFAPEEPVDGGGADEWPDYPPAGPVDLTKWSDPGNYPTPGMFHQVGGPNSATTLQVIARKALTTAFYLIHGDLGLAVELANRPENWRAYREAIDCSPWNHALYGSATRAGTSGAYETPHGDSISMYPAHAPVAAQLTQGEVPQRRVREDTPSLPAGGHHALLWLPPLDEVALAEGRVEVAHEHWWTGDWVIMPPPEVLALGVVDVPPGRTWGCGGYETTYDYEEVA